MSEYCDVACCLMQLGKWCHHAFINVVMIHFGTEVHVLWEDPGIRGTCIMGRPWDQRYMYHGETLGFQPLSATQKFVVHILLRKATPDFVMISTIHWLRVWETFSNFKYIVCKCSHIIALYIKGWIHTKWNRNISNYRVKTKKLWLHLYLPLWILLSKAFM